MNRGRRYAGIGGAILVGSVDLDPSGEPDVAQLATDDTVNGFPITVTGTKWGISGGLLLLNPLSLSGGAQAVAQTGTQVEASTGLTLDPDVHLVEVVLDIASWSPTLAGGRLYAQAQWETTNPNEWGQRVGYRGGTVGTRTITTFLNGTATNIDGSTATPTDSPMPKAVASPSGPWVDTMVAPAFGALAGDWGEAAGLTCELARILINVYQLQDY